jgi:hypothetical protein
MGAEPGLDAATRGGRPVSGDWMGEVGEAESSEDEASEESDSARPRRAAAWIGMGLLCGMVLSALEDIVYWFVREKIWSAGAEREGQRERRFRRWRRGRHI